MILALSSVSWLGLSRVVHGKSVAEGLAQNIVSHHQCRHHGWCSGYCRGVHEPLRGWRAAQGLAWPYSSEGSSALTRGSGIAERDCYTSGVLFFTSTLCPERSPSVLAVLARSQLGYPSPSSSHPLVFFWIIKYGSAININNCCHANPESILK